MDVELAKNILSKGKAAVPDRFPQPSLETAQVWAEALGRVDFPARLWAEAVTVWASSLVGARMATPQELIVAAFVVRDRWENDAAGRRVLEEHRLDRLNRNYARMGLEPVETTDSISSTKSARKAVHGDAGRSQSAPQRVGEIDIRTVGGQR